MHSETPPLSAGQIVTLLGGPTAISRHDEVAAKRSAVANWPAEGIPSKYWPVLARIASRDPKTAFITIEVLEQHTKRPAPATEPAEAA